MNHHGIEDERRVAVAVSYLKPEENKAETNWRSHFRVDTWTFLVRIRRSPFAVSQDILRDGIDIPRRAFGCYASLPHLSGLAFYGNHTLSRACSHAETTGFVLISRIRGEFPESTPNHERAFLHVRLKRPGFSRICCTRRGFISEESSASVAIMFVVPHSLD